MLDVAWQFPEKGRELSPRELYQDAVHIVQPSAFYWYCRARLGHNFSETIAYETRLQVLGFNDVQLLKDVKIICIALRELEREKSWNYITNK